MGNKQKESARCISNSTSQVVTTPGKVRMTQGWEGMESRKTTVAMPCSWKRRFVTDSSVRCLGISQSEGLRTYLQTNTWPFWISIPALIGSMVGLLCCGDMHRRFPQNYILLGIFTVAESYMVGTATLMYDTETVLQAVGITAATTMALVAYAFQTKRDFTTMGGALLSALMALIGFSFLMFFFPHNNVMHIAFSSFGAFLFSCYIVYDVQILMEGKKVQITPDDYVLAALNLYLDILNLFLYILSILGDSK